MQTREFLYCVLEPTTGKDRQMRQVKWLKPAEGWLKLNTDGAVDISSGKTRCGGLLRVGMAMGRVRAGFFHTWTRPAS